MSEPWPPRWLSPISEQELEDGDGDFVTKCLQTFCRITKDSVAGPSGQLMHVRDWQHQLLRHLFARRSDGRYKHRQALIGMARKNGKSSLAAGVALYGLLFGPNGGEVYSCAADREQARIVFGTARRMVELDPELSEKCTLYRDSIVFPETGSIYKVLSAEAYTKEGLNPSLVIFDEVHAQPTRELWDVMALASGSRRDPLLVGITTAGVKSDSLGADSLCYSMYQYGQRIATGEVKDPSFFFAWWEPRNPAADHRDLKTWEEANPGFGDLVDTEDFESSVLRTPEAEFRTKRVNQWVSSAITWLPADSWAKCEKKRDIPLGSDVVLGFDGSFNGDSTALVVVSAPTENEFAHIQVVESWEKDINEDSNWQVPILEVEDAIREACRKWQVHEIVCDPYRWARTFQVLESEGLPVVEYPQVPARMTPATTRFYEAVTNRQVTHSGDERLSRHIDNCVLKVDSRGSRLSKDRKNSKRHIDLAVASVMAFDRACSVDTASNDLVMNVW